MRSVATVCLVVVLAGTVMAVNLPVRSRRSAGWNDPDHPFPESSWSDWTPCTQECDTGSNAGRQARHNCSYGYEMPGTDILNSIPLLTEHPVESGCALLVAGCNNDPCDDKYDWQPFEDCSASCGGGTTKRLTGDGCWTGINDAAPACPTGIRFTQTMKCNTQSCTPPEGCGKADIMFVLDSSGSVGDFNWYSEKRFAIDISKGLEIGTDKTRIGVVSYSTEVQVDFSLHQHSTIAALEEAIWDIPWEAGYTNTADGIRLARKEFETNGRSSVKKIMIVVTDGMSNILNTTTIPQANLARADGILVFVIGIGASVNQAELLGIGNSPAETFVHHVTDFGALADITQLIVDGACEPVVNCGAWSDWGDCSVPCQGGLQYNTRLCIETIDEEEVGRYTEQQNQTCNTQSCPETECSDWEAIGGCSASCDGGKQTLNKTCITTQDGVEIDREVETKEEDCNTFDCPERVCNGWEAAGDCSVSCGGGKQDFKRSCRMVYYDGSPDGPTEEETEERDCNEAACPNWVCTEWEAVEECSESCGNGFQRRERSCGWVQSDGTPDSEPQTESEYRVCNLGPCVTDVDCATCLFEKGATDYLADPDSICHYYMCLRQVDAAGQVTYQKYHMTCPGGTYWNPNIDTCDHDTEGECSGPIAPPGPSVECYLVAKDGDNTVFINTVTGEEQPCAPGTVFDEPSCECVHGDNDAPTCTGPFLHFPFNDPDNFLLSVGCERVQAYQDGNKNVQHAWESKLNGRSAKFDGSSALVVPRMKNFFADNHIDQMTIAVWVKWTVQVPWGTSRPISGLVNNANCGFDASYDLHLGGGDVAAGSMDTDNSAGPINTGTPTLPNIWGFNHVVEVYDGSNLKLYVNGVLKSTTPLTGYISNNSPECSMIIGHYGLFGDSGFFTGLLDDLRVYLRALNAAAVTALYNANE